MPKISFDILTLFPEFFTSPLQTSLLSKAIQSGLIKVNLHQIRAWGLGTHRTVDDRPYGGGAGMVLRADVLGKATQAVLAQIGSKPTVILLDPTGTKLDQALVRKLAKKKHFLLVCGRYEGVDQRYKDLYVDTEISIGDYILSGGEAASLVLIEAISRLVKGVLGSEDSSETESFSPASNKKLLLEYPQYTRPLTFKGKRVPKVLLDGNHQQIAEWRSKQSVLRTKKLRPDLLKQ